ncbi:hypothetical protein J6590_056325 [Homalodisca vitripennis]|nr:hypothetical protein J6590_056325 [Homalodisca vitripennis]
MLEIAQFQIFSVKVAVISVPAALLVSIRPFQKLVTHEDEQDKAQKGTYLYYLKKECLNYPLGLVTCGRYSLPVDLPPPSYHTRIRLMCD